MKGIPELFNDIIRKHLNVHAAWLPVTNTIQLGDFGIVSNGVFVPQGNIQTEFGVPFNVRSGPASKIDFSSQGAAITKLIGGAQVNVIPPGTVNASISIEFQNEKSFIVKSPSIEVTAISNVAAVGKALSKVSGWRAKYKVVHQTYKALDAIVISTIDKKTIIAFTGDATALGQLQLGNAGLSYSSNKALGLEVQGKSGVLGIGLFKINSGFLGNNQVSVMRGAPKAVSKTSIQVEFLQGPLKNDW